MHSTHLMLDVAVTAFCAVSCGLGLFMLKLDARGESRGAERRRRARMLRDAPHSVASVALTRERLLAGSTHAFVRGVAHVEDGVLVVRDPTGVARVALEAAELWEGEARLRRIDRVENGTEVVAVGPARDGGHAPRGARAAEAVVELHATEQERPAVRVLRAA